MLLQTCGHYLCKSCWNCLITESVDSGPSCLHRLCPAVGCTLVVPEEFVEKYCCEKLTAYRTFHLESFVSQNKVGICIVFYSVIVQLCVVCCVLCGVRGVGCAGVRCAVCVWLCGVLCEPDNFMLTIFLFFVFFPTPSWAGSCGDESEF